MVTELAKLNSTIQKLVRFAMQKCINLGFVIIEEVFFEKNMCLYSLKILWSKETSTMPCIEIKWMK